MELTCKIGYGAVTDDDVMRRLNEAADALEERGAIVRRGLIPRIHAFLTADYREDMTDDELMAMLRDGPRR